MFPARTTVCTDMRGLTTLALLNVMHLCVPFIVLSGTVFSPKSLISSPFAVTNFFGAVLRSSFTRGNMPPGIDMPCSSRGHCHPGFHPSILHFSFFLESRVFSFSALSRETFATFFSFGCSLPLISSCHCSCSLSSNRHNACKFSSLSIDSSFTSLSSSPVACKVLLPPYGHEAATYPALPQVQRCCSVQDLVKRRLDCSELLTCTLSLRLLKILCCSLAVVLSSTWCSNAPVVLNCSCEQSTDSVRCRTCQSSQR